MRLRLEMPTRPGGTAPSAYADPTTANPDPADEPAGDGAPRGWRQRANDRRAAAAERLTPWPQANRFGTRALLLLLIVGVLAGPIALLRSNTISAGPARVDAPADTTAATAEAQARARTRAEGAATSLVWRWLSAGQADAEALDALLVYPPTQLNLPQKRPSPPAAVTVADATGSGASWTVTVDARGGQAGAGSTYRVAVQVDEQAATALTLPGQIPQQPPAPAGRERKDGPDQVSLSTDDPADAAAAGFVQTLLSGNGDLSRWTRPGSELVAIRPAPCSTAQATTTAATDPPEPTDGQITDVLATATCRTTTGRITTSRTLQYLLTLTARGGRWEVSAYTDTPGSATGQPPADSPTATSSTGTGSSSSNPAPTPTSATPR